MRSDSKHRRRFSLAGKLGLLFGLLLAVTAALAAGVSALGASPTVIWLITVALGLPLGLFLVSRFLRPSLRVLAALEDGVEGFRARDFSLRLAVDRGDELGELVEVYNDLADLLGRERSELRQRELLLQTVLETSPASVLLVNPADRVIYASRAARALFFGGRRLEGHAFAEILDGCPEPLRRMLSSGRDALVTVDLDGGADETFHVSRRVFELNSRRHLLIMVRRMTAELRRQEVAVWKKVLRVISHELNNSLAPIRSMAHSARLILRAGGDAERLEEIFDNIDQSAAGLHRFIEGYARFARLPEPRIETVDLRSFLEHLRRMEPFELAGEVPARTVDVDSSQIQQVLINLLKNAREAGSPPEDIAVAVDDTGGGLVIHVLDRGGGMDEEQMRRALVPFYSSKKGGTGLGLALSREILEAHGGSLELAARDGGGLVVSCHLPDRPRR
ncbi:MAG: ATP-binding protein [Thermoanaerobaculia bacterium]